MTDTTPWSHTFDFKQTSGGFVRYLPDGYNGGTWVEGTGWTLTDNVTMAGNRIVRNCDIILPIPSAHIIQAVMTYDLTVGSGLAGYGGYGAVCLSAAINPGSLLVSGNDQTLVDNSN